MTGPSSAAARFARFRRFFATRAPAGRLAAALFAAAAFLALPTGASAQTVDLTLEQKDSGGNYAAISSISESAGAITVRVKATVTGTLSTAQTVTVAVGASSDTAEEGSDYSTIDEGVTVLTIALADTANVTGTTADFTLEIKEDFIDEGDSATTYEKFSLNTTVAGAAVNSQVDITDNDAAPSGITLTLRNDSVPPGTFGSVNEGVASDPTITVRVEPTGGTLYATDQTVTVTIGATGSTATQGDDYTTSGHSDPFEITIAGGAAFAESDFVLDPQDDNVHEGVETVIVSGASGTLSMSEPIEIMLEDDDAEPGGIALLLDDGTGTPLSEYSVSEGIAEANNPTITVTAMVQESAPNVTTTYSTEQTVTVTIGNDDDTARAPADYTISGNALTGRSLTITIAEGAVSGTETFTLNPDFDNVYEPVNETITVSGTSGSLQLDPATIEITPPQNHPEPDISSIQLTLWDRDPTDNNPVELTSVQESASLTNVFVRAEWGLGSSLSSVGYDVVVTVGGDSTAGADDYTTGELDSQSQLTITIPADQRSGHARFELTPEQDDIDEGDGSAADPYEFVKLTNNRSDSSVNLEIADDDAAPTTIALTVDPSTVAEDASDTTITVTAEVQGGSTFATETTVTVSVAGTRGDAAVDFDEVDNFEIEIPAGEDSEIGTFVLRPTADNVDEVDEIVAVSGTTTVTGVSIVYPDADADADYTGVGIRLQDDDAAPAGIQLTVDQGTLDEGAGATTITVTAAIHGDANDIITTFATETTVTVSVAGTQGDAAVDFEEVDDFEIIIEKGETSGFFPEFTLTPAAANTVYEADEKVRLSGVFGASPVIATRWVEITLTDNTEQPDGITLTLHSSEPDPDNPDASTLSRVREGDGDANGDTTVWVLATVGNRTGTTYANPATVTVSVAGTKGETAVDFADVADFVINIGAEDKSAFGTFTLRPDEDNVDEFEEVINVTGTAEVNGVPVVSNVSVNLAALRLTDNDDTPDGITLTLWDRDPALPGSTALSSVDEGDGDTPVWVLATVGNESGTTYANPATVTVSVAGTEGDTAVDFEGVSNFEIDIGRGVMSVSRSFTLKPEDDNVDEIDEAISVTGMASVDNLPEEFTVTVVPAALGLTDNDEEPDGITLTLWDRDPALPGSTALSSVDEGDGDTTVWVLATVGNETRTTYAKPATVTVSVAGTEGVTAVDFERVDNFEIDIGKEVMSVSRSFTLKPEDDEVDEIDEKINVTGNTVVDGDVVDGDTVLPGETVSSGDPATLDLTDNELSRTLTVSSDADRVNEGDLAHFTVTLSGTVASDVEVNWATADGTAEQPHDYKEQANGSLTFSANGTGDQLELSFTVETVRDTVAEGDETFTVSLSGPVAAGLTVDLGTATTTATISDDKEDAAVARYDRVNREILPRVAQAMAASTVSAITGRIEAVTSGAPMTNVTDRSFIYRLLKANEDSINEGSFDLKALMDGRTFALPLHAGEDGMGGPGGLGGLSFWGSGDYTSLEGRPDSLVEWEGDVFTAHLGMDTRLNEKVLAGLSVSRSRGSFEFTDRTSRAQAEAQGQQGGLTVAGTYGSRMTGIHPYVNLSLSEDIGVWAKLGYGQGEVEIDDDQLNDPQSSDTEMMTVALGANGRLFSDDSLIPGGEAALKLKGEGAVSRIVLEGNDRQINPLTSDVQRLRMLLEGSYAREMESGAVVTPALEIGVRHDGGDAVTGTGFELGGSLRVFEPSAGVTVEGRGRILLAHEDEYEEWGVGGLVRFDPGAGGRGLSLSLAPVYGDTASGTARLWDGGADADAANDNAPQMRLNSELGYGFGALGGRGVLTPYGGVSLADEGAQSYRVGGRFGYGSSLGFSLEGERREPAGNGAAEHGVMLRMNARW